ncbi:hypothetical protein Pla52n_06530 [Stieleria varia]|uniref:Uncharacterized protein n=1 Tax=Stieleria varia TaxID=2528005 RepID=A0A5C6B8U9_9BACT|nr:hypothetical protein Pla52n_06530 [Stieleria varia]
MDATWKVLFSYPQFLLAELEHFVVGADQLKNRNDVIHCLEHSSGKPPSMVLRNQMHLSKDFNLI